MYKKNNKKAFTLSEVLVVLGIIGIISVMTLPSLISNYQKKVLSSHLQKAYSEISQAGALVMSDEMALDFKNTKTIRNCNFVSKYLKTRDLDISGFPTYKLDDDDNYDFTSEVMGYPNYSCGSLMSGAFVCITNTGIGILDTNGKKGPNQIGLDAFSIGFERDGSLSTDYSVYLENVIHHDWDIEKYDNSNW